MVLYGNGCRFLHFAGPHFYYTFLCLHPVVLCVDMPDQCYINADWSSDVKEIKGEFLSLCCFYQWEDEQSGSPDRWNTFPYDPWMAAKHEDHNFSSVGSHTQFVSLPILQRSPRLLTSLLDCGEFSLSDGQREVTVQPCFWGTYLRLRMPTVPFYERNPYWNTSHEWDVVSGCCWMMHSAIFQLSSLNQTI